MSKKQVKIMLVTQQPGKTFPVELQAAMREMGFDVLRGQRVSAKRINIHVDQSEQFMNKIHQFQRFKETGVSHVPFTTNKATAVAWFEEVGNVVCRKVVNGHSGEGIVIASSIDEMVDAQLYTKYIKKRHEFRVHIYNGKAIFIQQKKQRSGQEPTSYMVRNVDNGWVFCHKDLGLDATMQARLIAMAGQAVDAVGYTYGAVDIIWNEKYDKLYVLEVNSRPGIEGETARRYAIALLNEHGVTINE